MMQPKLLKACKQQLSKSGPTLTAKGLIKALTFIKADQTDARTEFYKVTFEKGQPETWLIGGRKKGKFAELYTDDE
jgi:phenylpyruvate tautomerase PptA (4-oxalocrotonate tautomerase family)